MIQLLFYKFIIGNLPHKQFFGTIFASFSLLCSLYSFYKRDADFLSKFYSCSVFTHVCFFEVMKYIKVRRSVANSHFNRN